VRGREELDYNAALEWAGLRLDTTAPNTTHPKADEAGYVYPLGATVAQDGERLIVRNVHAGEPAYEQGLNANDQIVAVDGYRATRDFLIARVGDKKPGDTITLTVFRADELRTFPFKLGARSNVAYRIISVASPTEQQRRNYQTWLGSPFPSASATTGVRP
jgi:predicted metalloprotease with PDZ domain